MALRYYPDTSIWIDLYEGRKGYSNEPLGEYAFKFFIALLAREDHILVSDITIRELAKIIPAESLKSLFTPFKKVIEHTTLTGKQRQEALAIAGPLGVPLGDAMHSIIARDTQSVLVTRDKHFRILKHISEPYAPEELI